MKWSASIALISPLLVAVVSTFGASTDLQQGQDAATQVGTSMQSYAGSGPTLSGNLVTPLIQGSQITTVDGKTKFVANGLKSSTNPVIQLTINPDPATGDLKNIILQQDLTGTGTLGYTQIFPIPGDGSGQEIAAICQNGYIQCNPNFNNCQYRNWVSASNGAVSAQTSGGVSGAPGNVGGLSACYCFDNFCTGQNNSLIELENISSDVGGGVLSSFLAANTGIAISSATSGSTTVGSVVLTYFGFNPGGVATGGKTSTMTAIEVANMPVLPPADTQTPQAYYMDSANLNNSAQSALAAQKAAPNSLYNLATNAALSQSGSMVTCTNSMQPALSSDNQTQVQNGSTQLLVDDSFAWSFIESTAGTFVFSGQDNKGLKAPDIVYTVNPANYLGGWSLQSVSFTGSWPAGGGCNGFSASPIWTPGIGVGVEIASSTAGGICGSPGYQSPILSWSFTVQYLTQKETDVVSNGCSSFETNADCTLQQDVWDGRPVVVNGMQMNNSLIGQICKSIPGVGALPAVTTCKPWFVQDRTFYCKSSATTYDFTTAKVNVATIENSTSMPSSSSMRYADPSQGGAIMTYGITPAPSLPGCSQICETKAPMPHTGLLYTDTPQSVNQVAGSKSDSQYLFSYKDCTPDGSGNYTCPLDATKSEVLVAQCGCSADLGTAMGALNAAGSAAQDAICSAE